MIVFNFELSKECGYEGLSISFFTDEFFESSIYRGFLGSLLTNIESDFENSQRLKWRIQHFGLKMQKWTLSLKTERSIFNVSR